MMKGRWGSRSLLSTALRIESRAIALILLNIGRGTWLCGR